MPQPTTMANVLEALVKQTDQGAIPWTRTVDKTAFTAVFDDLSVIVSSRTSGLSAHTTLYVLNERGDMIESAQHNTGKPNEHPQYAKLPDLFQAAKERAEGPDRRLSTLLERINSMPAPETKK